MILNLDLAASVPLHDLNTLANTRETHLKWT